MTCVVKLQFFPAQNIALVFVKVKMLQLGKLPQALRDQQGTLITDNTQRSG